MAPNSYDEDEDSVEEEDEEIEEEEPERKRRSRGKNKDPNKPKRNMSAFFLYSQANRPRVKEENPEAPFGDIAKLLSAEFKQLSDKDRKKWEKKAEKDKLRYQEEMKNYVPPDDVDDGGRKRKRKKDPNAPKRNMSAYFLYSVAIRPTIKEENPEATFGEIAKIISQKFKGLPEEGRRKWELKAQEDKARYEREMAEYKANH